MLAVIHCEPRIPWQGPFAAKVAAGLKHLGVPFEITSDRFRHEGLPILLGTTCWRPVEQTGEYLLVDRCSFGDTNQWVSLVRDGHGRRGNHRVQTDHGAARWEAIGPPVADWQGGSRIVLCGQTESYTPDWTLRDWYASRPEATHFRPHPAGHNPTELPQAFAWDDVGQALTLNSSVAVEALLAGVPTTVDDNGSMAWPGFGPGDDRAPWLHWLAWTQWHHDEIAEGRPWAHYW